MKLPGGKGGCTVVDKDEHPRPDTTLEALAKLKTPFRKDGTVTAGNASGVNDGAAAMIVASEAAVKAHGLTPRARILGMASAAVPPRIMGIGPVPSTQKLMARLGHKITDYDGDRTQRGVCLAIARGAAPARPCRRRRASQSAWRRHRARSSARHVWRAAGDDGGARPAKITRASSASPRCASASGRACRSRSNASKGDTNGAGLSAKEPRGLSQAPDAGLSLDRQALAVEAADARCRIRCRK